MKVPVYNLIILDQTGSMMSIAKSAVDGFNSTLKTIKDAKKKFADTQEQYISLILFNSDEMKVLYDKVDVGEVKKMKYEDYCPNSTTPLYDAIGKNVQDLTVYLSKTDAKVVDVTIITDGFENSSKEWTKKTISALIDERKKEGWNFSFEGTEGITEQGKSLGISNILVYSHTDSGYTHMSSTLNYAKTCYYSNVNGLVGEQGIQGFTGVNGMSNLTTLSKSYFDNASQSDGVEK